MRILKSALFWRILVSSLLVVTVLWVGLYRANRAHAELEHQFDRLVQHDLKLGDDAEQLLRLMADLETGKRGYLLTGDRSFLAPYEQARKDLEGVLAEAQRVAEDGIEDERVAAFGKLVRDWIHDVSEPQIRARERGIVPTDRAVADEGKARTDEMRGILALLRQRALDDASERQQQAFESAARSQRETRTGLLVAIVIALVSGIWIARDIAGATARLEESMEATGRLEPLRPMPARRDELGAVADSLAAMNALLLDKDARLRATLAERERTLGELARANQVKTAFLASMSHELRTPLSAILGFADLLLTSPREQLSPRARESLERIKRNGNNLLALINDVLDLAKAETGRVDLRLAAVNLGQLGRACVAEVDSLRSGKRLRLAVDEGNHPIEVVTDAQRVRQILVNLLSNAIKFTDEGDVELTVRASDAEVRLAVRDTGIGIADAAMAQLFQDFHQLEAGDGRRYEGTGMGLALSRRLARALGGDVEVVSREREGSTFTLVLPRKHALSVATTTTTSVAPAPVEPVVPVEKVAS